MREVETVEVPVTRRVRVRLIGQAHYVRPGMFQLKAFTPITAFCPPCRFVVRPTMTEGSPFRSGIATARHIEGAYYTGDTSAIPAFCSGDYVYLVEGGST